MSSQWPVAGADVILDLQGTPGEPERAPRVPVQEEEAPSLQGPPPPRGGAPSHGMDDPEGDAVSETLSD